MSTASRCLLKMGWRSVRPILSSPSSSAHPCWAQRLVAGCGAVQGTAYPQELEAHGADGFQLARGHLEAHIHQGSQAQDEPVPLARAPHSRTGRQQAVMAGVIPHSCGHVEQATRREQPGAQPRGGRCAGPAPLHWGYACRQQVQR